MTDKPEYQKIMDRQQPYLGLWQGIVARTVDLDPDIPIFKHDLDRWFIELWNEQPEAMQAFALATTRYGREDLNGD